MPGPWLVRLLSGSLAVAALGGALGTGWAAEYSQDQQEFRAAKASIQRLLKSKKPEDRAEAIRRLEGFPLLEAVKMAVKTGMADESKAVRLATYDLLVRQSDNQEVCDYLLAESGGGPRRTTSE